MSNKITITLQAKTDDAKRNIANLENDIKNLTTSIKSQSEIQKTHYNNIKSALNEQNKTNEQFAKRRQQIIQDTIASNKQLEESMKSKTNPLKEQLNAMEQAKSKLQNEQKALMASLGGDSTKANTKEKEQLSKREQDLNKHISEIKRLKKELTEVIRSQDYQDLSNQISNNKKLKTEQLEKLQADKQLYNQSVKLQIDNLKQEQNLNAQGLADNRKVLSEKQTLLEKEVSNKEQYEKQLLKLEEKANIDYEAIATKRAMEIKNKNAEQRLQNEKDYKDRLFEKQRRVDLIVDEYNQQIEATKLAQKQERDRIAPRQMAKAKESFTSPMQESWDTADMKKYYSEMEKSSKKAYDLEKQELDKLASWKMAKAKESFNKPYQESWDTKDMKNYYAQMEQSSKKAYEERELFKRQFVNTSAENKYNDTLARLNELQSRGVITSKEKDTALAKEKLSIDATEKSYSNLANTTIRYLRWAGTIAGVAYATQRAFQATVGEGIEVNKIVETNTYGIAALVSANTQMSDSLNKTLSPMQKFAMGQKVAADVLADLRVESVKTFATFPQLIEIFQQAIPHTLALGNAFGSSVEEINDNTVKFASRMSNLAGSIGMEMEKVKEEARSMLSGNASTDSLISTLLFGSPSEANEAIKKAKTTAGGLKKLLDLKLEPFDILADTKTYQRSVLEVQAAWQNLMGDMVKESGVFQDITDAFYGMSKSLTDNSKGIIASFDNIYNGAKKVASLIGTGLEIAAIISGVYAVSKASTIATSAILGIRTAMLALTTAAMANPIFATGVIVATGVGLIATKFHDLHEEMSNGSISVMDEYQKSIDDVKAKANETSISVKGIGTSTTEAVNESMPSVDKYIEKLTNDLLPILNTVKTKIKEAFQIELTPLADIKPQTGLFAPLEQTKKEVEKQVESLKSLLDFQKSMGFDTKKTEEDLKLKTASLSVIDEQTQKLKEQTKAEENLGKAKELSQLVTKEQIKDEDSKKIDEFIKQSKSKAEELAETYDLASKKYDELNTKYNKHLALANKGNQESKTILPVIEQEQEKAMIAMIQAQKQLGEEKEKTAEKEIARNNTLIKQEEKKAKTLLELNRDFAEQESIRTEIALIESGMFDDEKLKVEMSLLRISSLVKEHTLLTDMADKEKVKLELLREGLKYEQLISMEQQLRGDKSETAQNLITLNDQLLGIEKNITSEKARTFFNQVALTAMKVEELLISKQITQAEADAFNTKLQAIAETRIAQDEYQKNLAVGIKDFDDAIKNIQNQTVTIDVKFNGFNEATNGFASIANGIIDISNANSQVQEQESILAETRKNYPRDVAKIGAEEKKLTKIKSAQFSTTIDGYGSMIGALGNFYDEDDSRREKQQKMAEVFHYIKMAQQISEMAQSTAFTSLFVAQETAKATAAGTTAVAVAAQSSPWTGFATAAAMIALLASVGLALGAGGSGKEYKNFGKAPAENTGTGTVLGDISAQSESMRNSLEILEEYKKPEFQVLQSMNKYLANISNSIGGVSSLIVQKGGISFGAGYVDSGVSKNQKISYNGTVNAAATMATGALGGGLMLQSALASTGVGIIVAAVDKILLDGAISKTIGKIIDPILGGLFGKTSSWAELKGSGIAFGNQLLKDARSEIFGSEYQTIKTTTKTSSWLKGTKETSKTKTKYYDMAGFTETERQFSLILDNMYNSVYEAGVMLGENSETLINNLDNFVVSLGHISFKDKSGDQIQKDLESIFGAIGDSLAGTAMPILAEYQSIGEGMLQTLTKVATGMEVADYYAERLGTAFEVINFRDIENKQGDIGFEALLQTIEKFDEALYGVDNNLMLIVENIDGTAEELYGVYSSLSNLRDMLLFMNIDTDAVSYAAIRGAGSAEALADSMNSYFENFLSDEEQLKFKTQQLNKEFEKLNLTMPQNKDGFVSLVESIDETTESGQNLFGRLILLSNSFAEITENSESLSESLKKSAENIKSFINSFKSENLLAEDLSKELGIGLAKNYDELKNKLKDLALDKDGLTDIELNLLNTNKSYIERLLVQENDAKNQLLEIDKEKNQKLLDDAKTTAENIKSSISAVDSMIGNLKNTIEKLRDTGSSSSKYGLNRFYASMAETQQLFKGKDYKAIQESLEKTIGYSSVLNEEKNFALNRDMRYAQLVAANQFESMDVTLKDELDYLKLIEQNTSKTVDTLTATLTALGSKISDSLDNNSDKFDEYAKSLEEIQRQREIKDFITNLKSSNLNSYEIASKSKKYLDEKSISYSEADSILGYSTGTTMQYFKDNIKLFVNEVMGMGISDKQKAEMISSVGKENKLTLSEISTWAGYSVSDTEAWFKQLGVPSFAVGTTNVPHDMTANIHKGEIITPRTYSDGIRNGDLFMGNVSSISNGIDTLINTIVSKFNDIISIQNRQLIELRDSRDISNDSLVSLQKIEKRI